MHAARFRGWVTGLLAGLGVVCTMVTANADTTSADTGLAQGRALRRAGKETEALAELRRARSAAAGKGDVAVRIEWEIARTHIAKRDFQAAMATCKGMSKTAPAESRVCAAEAHLLWRRGTEAMNELAEMAKLKDVPLDARYFAKIVLGRADELATKDADAEAAYRSAIAIADDRAPAHTFLGALLHRLGKDGVPELRRAAAIDPKDPTTELELGRALASDPAKTNEAIGAFERAVAERPTYTDALRGLTEAYLAAQRTADARKTAEATLKLAPHDVHAHIAMGRVALAEGRADDALAEGEAAVKLMPNEAKAKLLVADAYAKKGEIDLALEAYQAAHGLDHGDPTPLVNAARACLVAARPTSAKAFAKKATEDFPSHAPAWVVLGDALVVDKDVPGARNAYDTAKKQRNADVAGIDAKLARLRDARPQS